MKLKYYFELKRCVQLAFAAAGIAFIYNFSTIHGDMNTQKGMFEAIVGYNDFIDWSIQNLYGIFPIFIISLPLINYFVKEFSKNSTYIFTRIKSRSYWILGKQAALAVYTFLASAVYFTVKLLMINDFKFSYKTVASFIVFYLFLLLFCSCVCTLSLFTGTVKSFLICVLCFVLFCYAVTFYYYTAVSEVLCVILNPVARFMLNWKDDLAEIMRHNVNTVLSISGSAVYYAALIALNVIISAVAVNRKNICVNLYDEE